MQLHTWHVLLVSGRLERGEYVLTVVWNVQGASCYVGVGSWESGWWLNGKVWYRIELEVDLLCSELFANTIWAIGWTHSTDRFRVLFVFVPFIAELR